MNSDITVRICSYNRPEYLREALLSVLAQKKRAKFIEIFDNASEAVVYNNIRDLLGANISWNPTKTNIGGPLNIQRAFYAAKTKYLFIMHDDDRLLPDFLIKQIEFLEANPTCVAVSCNAHYIDRFGSAVSGGWPSLVTDSVLYTTPQSLALVYAETFLGFPGFVYKSSEIGKMSLRSELGKTADVGLILDLVKRGPIGFQNRRLLEYRIHGEQDSEYFSENTVKILYDFLKSFSAQNDSNWKKIDILFRSRLKNTFIQNLLNGKSGMREIIWMLKMRDLKLLFMTITSLIIRLPRNVPRFFFDQRQAQ